jgi:hypothetical protein
MTSAQVKRLETILGKVEALENEIILTDERTDLGQAKKYLLMALRRGGRGKELA